MASRNFPTFCSVCEWTGYFQQEVGTDFPDERVELCPNHGGIGMSEMTVEKTADLRVVQTREKRGTIT